jgi:hypothetical protein
LKIFKNYATGGLFEKYIFEKKNHDSRFFDSETFQTKLEHKFFLDYFKFVKAWNQRLSTRSKNHTTLGVTLKAKLEQESIHPSR